MLTAGLLAVPQPAAARATGAHGSLRTVAGAAGAQGSQPGTAGAVQGSLRAADPTLVQDGDTWVSMSTNESLSAPNARACDPADPVWSKGFAYIPYRTGPSPDQLGDCYGGDVMPGGPGPWADRPPTMGMWLPGFRSWW